MAKHRLRSTPSAKKAADNLSGKPRLNWERITGELEAAGCRAGGHRLMGDDGRWSPYCSRLVYGEWRVITTYATDEVAVVAIGQHDGPAMYRELGSELGTAAVGVRREDKPDCCGPDGWPTLGEPGRSRRAAGHRS